MVATPLQYARLGLKELREIVDVKALVHGIKDSLEETLTRENAVISIDQDILEIDANPSEVATLFRNLINNGVKCNTSDQKEVQIGYLLHAVAGENAHRDVFFVKDNGIGIEADMHDDVVKMFKRVHAEPDFGDGMGAGLAFVKKIIENAGGAISLTSSLGNGTTFFFAFSKPLDPSAAQ